MLEALSGSNKDGTFIRRVLKFKLSLPVGWRIKLVCYEISIRQLNRANPFPLRGRDSDRAPWSWVTVIAWNAMVARDAIARGSLHSSFVYTWIHRVGARMHVFTHVQRVTHTAATWCVVGVSIDTRTRSQVRSRCASMCTHMFTCIRMRWMRYTLHGTRIYVTCSRHVSARHGYCWKPAGKLASNDGSRKLYKESERQAVYWVDEMETGAWMCAFRRHGHWSSALFRLVLLQHCAHVRSRFLGIVCNQRTDASEQGFSLFLPLFFFSGALFSFFRERSWSCLLVWRIRDIEERLWIFICEIVFHLSLCFVGAFRNTWYIHAWKSFTLNNDALITFVSKQRAYVSVGFPCEKRIEFPVIVISKYVF